MYAVQLFNQTNHEDIACIYGAITNGYEWIFLKLNTTQVVLDIDRYAIQNLSQLLGIWQSVINASCK